MADLGVHPIKNDRLLERLHQYAARSESSDVWKLYGADSPTTGVLLHVPEHYPDAIDMGTGPAFHRVVPRMKLFFQISAVI